MQTIFQSTETAFNAITIQDAIVMLPVVDDICRQRINQIEQIEKREEREKNGERTYYEREKDHNELIQIEDRIRIMLKLGFCPSSPAMLQNFNMGED